MRQGPQRPRCRPSRPVRTAGVCPQDGERKMTTTAFSEMDLSSACQLLLETCRGEPLGKPPHGRIPALHVSFSSPGDFSSCQGPVEERSIWASREAVCLPPRESHRAEPTSTSLTRKRPSQSGRRSRIHAALGSFLCGVGGGGPAGERGQGRGASIGALSKMEASVLFGCRR